MSSPININVNVKGVEKLFEMLRSYFGMRMMRATAEEQAKAFIIEADAKHKVRLLAAETKAAIRLIDTKADIEQKKAEVEGKHELAMLRKQLKVKELPPPEEEIIVDIDDLFVEPTPSEVVGRGGQGNPYEFVEQRRFRNTKQVLNETFKALPEHTEISEEPVDPDWYARLFDYVKDISDETMQKLWGRLLAGELAHPQTFSLRALDVFRNLSAAEARLFARFCGYCTKEPKIFAPIGTGLDFKVSADAHIMASEPMRLVECGLLRDEGESKLISEYSHPQETRLIYRRKTIRFFRSDYFSANMSMHVYSLTSVGRELAKLGPREEDQGYIRGLCEYARSHRLKVEVTDTAPESATET